MKKVMICGYRDWSYELYSRLEYTYDCDMVYIDDKDFLESSIEEIKPDIIFFVGWSWIIKQDIVDKYNCVCLHPSPLPKYRGGSPIQHQIINGEKESAVTLFKIDDGIDTGDILYQENFSLDGNLNDIFQRVIDIGVNGVCSILEDDCEVVKQNEEDSTTYKRRTKNMSEIEINDFQNYTAKDLYNKIRALQNPYPNAFVRCKDNTKLFITHTNLGEKIENN
jgi:methionyl-tRNA formyltransferase